jgi:hypothetical protein
MPLTASERGEAAIASVPVLVALLLIERIKALGLGERYLVVALFAVSLDTSVVIDGPRATTASMD